MISCNGYFGGKINSLSVLLLSYNITHLTMADQEEHIVSLERLINHHKSTSRYCYVDELSNRTYSQEKLGGKPESTYPEDYLRALWNIIDLTYFKSIGQDEVEILNCIHKTESDVLGFYEQKRDSEFQEQLSELFTDDYLNRQRQCSTEQMLHDNWKQEMHLHWKFNRSGKKSQTQYREFRQKVAEIRRNSKLVGKSQQEKELYDQTAKKLSKSSDCGDKSDSKERQLLETANNNAKIIDKVFEKVHKQVNERNQFMRRKVCNELPQSELEEFEPVVQAAYAQYERITITNYIKYQIQVLGKKQFAESLAKIIEKKDVKGKNIYQVCLEEPLGMVQISEQDLIELNSYRDTSLLQCYNVGWKSRYNFVCHNYIGFEALIHRNEQSLQILKAQNMLPFLSKTNQYECSLQAKAEFASLQACHDCRLLYNKNILKKCSYKVSKQHHEPLPVYFDPYIYFLIKNEPKANEESTKALQKLIEGNFFQYYELKDGDYYCGRYLCKMCSKNHLGSNCKMCQQVCICGRCMRNSMISKLITIYAMMGGNVFQLRQKSYFSKFLDKPKNPEIIQGDKQRFAREKTMASYKMQFEELRLLAHMVMRREKVKEEQFLCEQRIFREKLQAH